MIPQVEYVMHLRVSAERSAHFMQEKAQACSCTNLEVAESLP